MIYRILASSLVIVIGLILLFSIEILLANDESWKTFNTLNSGLAGNNVAAIVSDPDGVNIWFGSGEDTLFVGEPGSRGASNYNKSTDEWETITTDQGLIHNSVFSIDADDYFVWFGTRGGVSRYAKNTKTWTNFTTDSGLVENHIKQVKIGMEYVWFVSEQGKVCTFEKKSGQWSTFNVMLGSRVQAIDIDENFVWFGTDNGVGKYDKNTFQWETYTSVDGLIDNYVTCLATNDSYIWFGTQKGVSRFDKNTNDWITFTTSNSGLINNNISAIEVEDHFVWFVTKNKGISRLEKNTGIWETFNSENSGLSENFIQAIEIDAKFVWFGTKRRGVSRYEKNKSVWRTFNNSDDLANNNVFSIGVDNNFVWFGTQEGISRFDKKIEKFTTFNILNSELTDDVILCMAMEDDYVWFGTEGGGVCRYKKSDGSWDIFDTASNGIADDLIQCIALDGDYVWMGTRDNGLSRYCKSSNECKNFSADYIFPGEYTLPSNDVRSIAVDKDYVWVGFWHPASLIEEAVFSRYEKRTGRWKHFKNALFGSWLAGNNVQSLGIDGYYMWLGFFEPWAGAMNRYKKSTGKLEIFTYDDGLADRNVWAIGIDDRFNWFGTGSGVNRFDKKYEYFLTFNVSEGLANNWVRSIGVDKDCVWLGTIGGGISRYKDQSAPIIIHDPVTEEKPLTQAISISARIEENVLVTDAWLFYKITSSSAFDSIRMKNQFADYWVEEIPANSVTMEGIDYFLKADDGYNVGYHPWHYPSTPPHHISVYDDTPPEGYIKISPSYGKDVVFNNDWIYVEGNIDGTSSIPKIAGIQIIQYNIVGNQISRTNFPSNLITLKGEGTVREIGDSLNVGSLNENTSSIELAITISESDSVQDKTFYSNRLTVLQDRDSPICVISQPTEGIEVGQVVPIIGTVYDAHLKGYKLEYGKGKKPTVWKSIPVIEFQPTVNIIDSLLGKWYTYELPDTIYSLRLNAWDYANHISKDSVWIITNKKPILAGKGGEVFSPDGMVKAYIPPNALDKDTPIAIEPVKDIPQIDDSTLTPINVCYEFKPSDLILSKPMTVTFYYTDERISEIKNEEHLSLYRWNNKNSVWSKVGGTINPASNNLTVAFKEFGIYGVMDAISVKEGKLSISTVDCQPRLFSPRGSGHSVVTNISFHLGKDSNVTIKVFNLAGRLIRNICENRFMTSGINSIVWDGKDSSDGYCISGLYVVLIQAEEESATKTVMVLNK